MTRRGAMQLLAATIATPLATVQVGNKRITINLSDSTLIEVKHGIESVFISSRELFDALHTENEVEPRSRLVDGHCPVCGFKSDKLVATFHTNFETERTYACQNCGNVFWAPVVTEPQP